MSIFRLPRATSAERTGITPQLGELIYDTTNNTIYRGDGTTVGGVAIGGGSSAYIHTQGSPATTWTINHNLGFRPSVELFTVGGTEFDADIAHPTVNQTVITLTASIAGSARLT